MIWHDPVATPLLPDSGAWHERVPSLTVTVPVGVGSPAPVGWPATWTVVVIGWPTTGLAVVEVIEVADADFCAWGVTVTGALGPESPTVVWAMTVTV